MNNLLPPSAIILVSVVPKPRDLEIARVLGWYRIPLRFAPKIIEVDYLALYQPSLFGSDHRWRVEFLAEVRGHELTTRQELFRDEVDHPRAHEEYYKIQLGPLIPLEHPIKAVKWKRLTFLFTLGDIFSNAQTIDDLILKSEHRQSLWKTLKERTPKNSSYRIDPENEMEIDPEILVFLGNFKRFAEPPAHYID